MNRREFTKSLMSLSAVSLIDPIFATSTERSPFAVAFNGLSADLPLMNMNVSGVIPKQCQVTLYRNGPALFERAGQRYSHWFDPDGMIQAFSISDKTITHKSRFVRTEKFIREDEAGQFLFDGAASKIEGSVPVRNNDTINVANTNVQPFNGELLALWEGGSAHRIEPMSLQTLGKKRWSDELSGVPFSAHPRLDSNGDLWNIGSLPMADYAALVLYHIGADGKLKNSKVHRLAFGGYQHDFVLTPNYLIALNSSAVAHHGDSFVDQFQWEPERASQILVYSKQDLSLVKTIEVPPAFVFHFGNAWENGGKVFFTASQYANANFMKHGMARLAQQLAGPYDDETKLLRYELDVTKGQAKIDYLGTNLEFPNFDRRFPFALQSIIGASDNRDRDGAIQAEIVVVDTETGTQQRYDYGPDVIVEEPQFIPDDSARSDSGFILHGYLNFRTERSGVAILRRDAVAEGPIMTAEMDRCLPLGFHGCFVA